MCVRFVRLLVLVWIAVCAVSAGAWASDTFPGTTLTGSSGSIVGTTVGMTGETGEPLLFGGGNMTSDWYSWTATGSGRFTIGTCNLTGETVTNTDTTLGAYTGSAVNALTLIGNNDDTTGCNSTVNPNYGAFLTFSVTAGTTYRFQVDTYASGVQGTFTLRWGLSALSVSTTDASATEGGDTAAFTVRPLSPPAGSSAVTVTIGASSPASQCTFSPTTLSFTSANFTTPQTVTVTATNDGTAEGTHSCAPATITAAGTGYAGVTATPPTLTIYDNDNPAFTISKSVSSGSIAAPGTLTYTITVDNTGSAVLTGMTISDALTQNGSGRTLTSGPTLSSGDTNSDGVLQDTETWIYTATYAVTQANIDTGGSFSNTATFDPLELPAQTSAAAVTTITQTPNYTITKAQVLPASSGPVTAAGQTLSYSITVANTGNVSLTSPTLTSDTFQLGGVARTLTSGPSYSSGDTDSDGAIDVGESWVYAASYTVPQADIDGTGSFTNVAAYTAAPAGAKTSNTVTTSVTRTASFTILKAQSGGPNPVTATGQTISYLITIDNTGNRSLTSPSVTDSLTQASSPRTLTTGPTYSSGDTDSDGAVDPDEVWLYTATYSVALSDMNNGGTFSNTATFTSVQAGPTTSSAVTTPVTQSPSISVNKSFVITTDSGTAGQADTNDIITYYYDVTNTGNVTLSNVSVSDAHGGSGTPPSPAPATLASLAPGVTHQFTATYTVTQTDFDNQ